MQFFHTANYSFFRMDIASQKLIPKTALFTEKHILIIQIYSSLIFVIQILSFITIL